MQIGINSKLSPRTVRASKGFKLLAVLDVKSGEKFGKRSF